MKCGHFKTLCWSDPPLGNTAAIKQYEGLKHRGDESDARQLAHLLRLGLLPEGYIIPKAMHAARSGAKAYAADPASVARME